MENVRKKKDPMEQALKGQGEGGGGRKKILIKAGNEGRNGGWDLPSGLSGCHIEFEGGKKEGNEGGLKERRRHQRGKKKTGGARCREKSKAQHGRRLYFRMGRKSRNELCIHIGQRIPDANTLSAWGWWIVRVSRLQAGISG